MSRTLGTVVRGVRAPIFREGDNVVQITADTVLNALKDNGITARDGDIVAITESVVARCQNNYATVEQIAADVRAKTGGQTVGVTFPILSRNRFSLLLQGIAAGVKKVVLMLSYPSDEVGNHLVSMDQLDEAGIDPWHDVLSLEQFRAAFGAVIHPSPAWTTWTTTRPSSSPPALRRRSCSPTASRRCWTTPTPSSAATSTPASAASACWRRRRQGGAGAGRPADLPVDGSGYNLSTACWAATRLMMTA